MSTKSRAVSAKGVEEFKTYITRALPLNAVITCADNTGAKTLRIIMVIEGQDQARQVSCRLGRRPHPRRGEEGPSDLRKQTFGAVIVETEICGPASERSAGCFEDNAAVLVTPEGEMKGTDIKGPVASEAAEKWPRLANIASIVV